MKTLLKFLIPFLLIGVVIVLLQRQYNTEAIVAPAIQGTAVNAVTGTVEVLAYIDIKVKAKNRGEILRHAVKPGEAVEAGQLLTVQESADLDLRIEQLKIRIRAARARDELLSPLIYDLETIDEELASMELGVKLGQRSESALERIRRDREKTQIYLSLEGIQEKENLEVLESQLKQLELQRAQMETRAPFSGTVVTFNAFKGDLVNGGQNLMRLISRGRYLILELSEEDYFGVEDGQAVTIRLASYPDRTFQGTVERLEDAANAQNKTRNVIVIVDVEDSIMVPGLTGEGFLVKGERDDAVLIPRRALIGNLVYVVKNGVVEMRRVTPGYLGLNKAEIIEGIEVGEEIVLENQNLLRSGQKVSTRFE